MLQRKRSGGHIASTKSSPATHHGRSRHHRRRSFMCFPAQHSVATLRSQDYSAICSQAQRDSQPTTAASRAISTASSSSAILSRRTHRCTVTASSSTPAAICSPRQKRTKSISKASFNFLGQFLLTVPKCLAWADDARTYALTLLQVKDYRFLGARSHLSFDRDNLLFPLITSDQPAMAINELQQLIVEAHGQG